MVRGGLFVVHREFDKPLSESSLEVVKAYESVPCADRGSGR